MYRGEYFVECVSESQTVATNSLICQPANCCRSHASGLSLLSFLEISLAGYSSFGGFAKVSGTSPDLRLENFINKSQNETSS